MAHITDLGFTLLELGAAKDAGDVRSQVHPEFPTLEIFNYTEDVQYRNKWNRITLACRGLILDTVTGEVIARPWEKFFNFGQRDNRIDSDGPVEVTDKVDGSLGILYRRPDGKVAIATRGSFASEQALHATALWQTEYEMYHDFNEVVDEFTFLFEIIYPENRIVCNYGDMDDLVLLGAVHKAQGYYLGPLEANGLLGWLGPVTEVWRYDHFVDALSFPDRQGKEGVVIRSGRNIVKLKQADYVELHRIVTNLSPKTIWEMLQAGKTPRDICSEIPDEFHKYVTDIAEDLYAKFAGIKFSATMDFNDIKYKLWNGDSDESSIPRRKYAELITKSQYPALLFNMLDGKPVDDSIWKMIKPRGDIKSLVKDEG
jgi:RNA ligase